MARYKCKDICKKWDKGANRCSLQICFLDGKTTDVKQPLKKEEQDV